METLLQFQPTVSAVGFIFLMIFVLMPGSKLSRETCCKSRVPDFPPLKRVKERNTYPSQMCFCPFTYMGFTWVEVELLQVKNSV